MHNPSRKTISTATRIACGLLVAAIATTAPARDFYVAANGSDENPGTLAKPFATIARARDAVRPLIATMTSDITVWIRGGRYHLKSSIALDDRDGGKDRHQVIYRNYKDEKVTVLGGVPVTGWTPYERGIMKASVGKNIEFWSLLVDDKLATMAGEKKWNSKPLRSARNLQIYSQKSWMAEYLRVTSVDPKAKKLELEFPRSSLVGRSTFMLGSYTFIDKPGEWAVDSDSGTVYYLPKSPGELKNVVRPTVKSIFQIRGRSNSQLVKNIVIEGLRLLLTDFNANMRCYSGKSGDNGNERQNIDYPNTLRTALITIENAKNIQIRYCDMAEAPINAVSIYNHATDNTVYGCRMNNLGYSGVYLAGRDFRELSPCINKRNTVKNCLISNLTKAVNHPAGIYIYQSGDNIIQNNMIHTSRRYAVSIKGTPAGREVKAGMKKIPSEKWYEYIHSNRNRISHNYIYDCVRDSSDGGTIETWGGGRDNVCDHNIIFNGYNGKEKSGWRAHTIFLDNGSSHWTLSNNIIWDTHSPAPNASCMLKCQGNTVYNNVFDASLTYLGGIDNQGRSDNEINRNIIYANNPLKVHSNGKVGPEKDGTRRPFQMRGHAIMASMDNNVYYNAQGTWLFDEGGGIDDKTKIYGTFDEWRKATQDRGFDKNSLTSDPQFIDVSARDYRLRETSPALDLGISSIDTFSIGLLEDFPFAPEDDPLKTAFLKANGKDVYIEAKMDDTVKLQVTGRTKNWFVADLSRAKISYKTDSPNVATVSNDGVVKVRGKGRVSITATVTVNGVTRSDDVVIYVGVKRRAR